MGIYYNLGYGYQDLSGARDHQMASVLLDPFPHQHNLELYNLQGQSTTGAHANPTQGSMRDPSLETAVSIFVA